MLKICKTESKILFFVIIATLFLGVFSFRAQAKDSPKIVLDSYSVVEGNFKAGEESVLRIKLKNTHAFLDAENILLTYQCENKCVYSSFGNSNQIFIKKIAAKEVDTEDIVLSLAEKIEDKSIPLSFKITYVDSKSKANFEDSFAIDVPVDGMNYVKDVCVASSTTCDEKTNISATIENTGSEPISALKMVVEGDIYVKDDEECSSSDGKVEFELNDVESGKEKNFEKNVFFNKLGKNSIKISFEYKGKNKEVIKQEAGDYCVNVIENENKVGLSGIKIAGNEMSLTWIVCSGVGILALIVMFVVRIKTKKE